MKDMHELEVYACIEGYHNYLVTSHGRVLSLKYRKIRELKQGKDRGGYLHVSLFKNGRGYSKRVHRLVAEAFIHNYDNKNDVNHIDENKTNNHVSNLEWMTRKENLNYGSHNERMSNSLKGRKLSDEHKEKIIKSNIGKKRSDETKRKISGKNNYQARAVVGFKINGCAIKYYTFISECENDCFNTSNISSCCRKKRKSHKGYDWYYADEYFNIERNDKE